MTNLAIVNDDIKKCETILGLATRHFEAEECFLDELVAKHQPADQQAFRLARRAEWLAFDAAQSKKDLRWSSRGYNTMLRECAQRVVDGTAKADDYFFAEEFTRLMQQITA